MNPETQGDSSVNSRLIRGLQPENPRRLHDGEVQTYILMYNLF